MTPTPEQLEAAVNELNHIDGSWALMDVVEAAWDVIAPMVLEAAAKVADEEDEDAMASWIRALTKAK